MSGAGNVWPDEDRARSKRAPPSYSPRFTGGEGAGVARLCAGSPGASIAGFRSSPRSRGKEEGGATQDHARDLGRAGFALAVVLFAALGMTSPTHAQGEPRGTRALRADLDALGAEVVRLEDAAAVERLQKTYGYYVDFSQFYDVVDLFAEDSQLEIGGRGVFLGKARIFAYMRELGPTMGPVRDGMYFHQQFQPVVTLSEDGSSAAARLAAFVMAGSVWGDVTYENHYVKGEDGLWRIASLRAPFSMYAEYADGWAVNPSVNTRPESWAPPPDRPPSVVTLMFPNYYVAPFHYRNPVTGRLAPPPDPRAGGVSLSAGQETEP